MDRLQRIGRHLEPPAAGGAAAGPAAGGEPEGDDFWVRAAGELRTTGLPGPDSEAGPEEVGREIAGHFFLGYGHKQLEDWAFEHAQGGNIQYSVMELANRKVSTMIQVTDPRDAVRLLNRHNRKAPGYEHGILRQGVLSQPDPVKWRRQRDLIKPAFSTQSLARLVPVMEQGVREWIEEVLPRQGEYIDGYEQISLLTFQLIGHAALGETSGFLRARAERLRHAFDVGFSFARIGSPEKVEAERVIAEFCDDVIERAAPQGCPARRGQPTTLREVLVQTDAATGCPVLSRDQQHDELTTFQFAGHDTSGNTLCWIIYELARHPDCAARLRAELDRELPADGADLSYAQLGRFKYLTRCINETLRLWPPVAAGSYRQLECDEQLHRPDGSTVTAPKGSLCHFSPWVLHHNPALWEGPSGVHEWDPDRPWNAQAFIPFMRGARDCAGRNLALLEIRLVLARLFSRFEVDLHPEDEPQEYGFYMATVRPRGAMRFRFRPRAD